VSVSFPVEFTVGDETFRERASALSGGGLFFAGLENLEPGTAVSIQFRPAKHLPVIEAKARVCSRLPGEGTALEFTEIQPEHRQMLLRLIHHKTADKRRYPRAALATQIECQQCVSLACSRNVSSGGMFVETAQPLPVDTRINVRFNLDDDGPVVTALAQVTYQVVKLGMGIEFVDLSPADRKRIEAYVARSANLPGPASAQTAPS
jgi:c-di-GMP-binding flagellar brake protein YcgR